MTLPRSDLSDRLRQRRDDALYRRQRAVRQFAHRMRAAVILVCLLWALMAYSLALLRIRWQVQVPLWLDDGLMALTWAYGVGLPLVFIWRTRLSAYVLYEHWIWLTLWLALPLDWYVLRLGVGRWSWLPVLTLALLGLGRLLAPRRRQRFERELIQQAMIWQHLLSLGVRDLLIIGFWRRG